MNGCCASSNSSALQSGTTARLGTCIAKERRDKVKMKESWGEEAHQLAPQMLLQGGEKEGPAPSC